MARRSEHTQEQIREMVLKAAETIVIDEGVNALTVRKVAMEIGYTVGSIYMVFENMRDLIMHVKGRTLDELADELDEVSSGEDAVERRILAVANAYLGFAHDHYNRWRMIFDASNNEPAPAWYLEKIARAMSIVETLFRQLLPDASAEQVAAATQALWSGVHGVCVLSLNGSLGRGGEQNTAATVQLLTENFIRGWKATAHREDA